MTTTDSPTATALALKEWGAAIHALLDGRQTILLRKGGIHEKAFVTPEAGGGFLLFPTVAHTHAERTRPEHHDLLARGDADVAEDAVTIRAAMRLVGAVDVARPDRLPEIADLHIWTDASIQADRVDFRPKKALQVLVVQAVALPDPVTLPRIEAYGGCRSWIDVHAPWAGEGRVIHDGARLADDLDRVRQTVG
ncbi:DUF1802 family protein [Euzebya sp.]|uniref:DUF1802 family protein n=1 Tax=Euzebya sp. TaxID=1971409 RepID=UPI003519930B